MPFEDDDLATATLPETAVLDDLRTERELAPFYSIVMHDDPVTTMDFVVRVLVELFDYPRDRAFEIMYTIHHTGLEKVALLPLERAEMKVIQVHHAARAQGYPLTCTIEREELPVF